MSKKKYHGRTELRKAALKRREDAWALLKAGRPHARGAAYLGGNAIECKLKAIAMEIFDCWTLDQLAQRWEVQERDVYHHGLEAMARRLPLYQRLMQSAVAHDFNGHVNKWRVHWRYDPKERRTESARAFLAAVDRVSRWLDRNQ